MANEVSLMNPAIGIETVAHYESERMVLPSKGEARVLGSKVENNLQSMYGVQTVSDKARDLTVPRFSDNSIFMPTYFDAAMYDTADKMKIDPDDDAAAATMQALKATHAQWRENKLSLSMA